MPRHFAELSGDRFEIIHDFLCLIRAAAPAIISPYESQQEHTDSRHNTASTV